MSVWNYNVQDLQKVKTPLSIVKELCTELGSVSGWKIIARVTEYYGEYRSRSGIFTPDANDFDEMPAAVAFDVQDVMGENAHDNEHDNKFVYELYVTSKETPRYKYRVFIMYYGIDMYPVGLTIQENIAQEIRCNSEGILCKDEDSFMKILEKILGSNTLGSVLRNLAALNL